MESGFGRALYRARTGIERSFGNATSFGGGLAPLPARVRGLARVRTWVWAKLLINAARILKGQGLTHTFEKSWERGHDGGTLRVPSATGTGRRASPDLLPRGQVFA
jgi:hypothetical protein